MHFAKGSCLGKAVLHTPVAVGKKKFMKTIVKFFSSGIGSVIKAILILLLAFIVAAIVKAIVVKLLNKTKLGKSDSKAVDGEYANKTVELIGKLVQLIVFLLFVPGIFESLGMTTVSAPILSFLNTVWGYVPNIIACGLILWIGFYVARLVRELLVPVLNKLEVNRLQKVAGIEVSEKGELSNTIGYIVYVLILIPIIITALQVLDIKAISDPAVSMLSIIFNYIPSILAALIIIVIGWILAKFIGDIITRLIEASGLDAKIASLTDLSLKEFSLSEWTGKLVQAVLVVFFVVEAFSTLKLGVLTTIGTKVIEYMPSLLAAIIIFALAFLAANMAASSLKKHEHPAFAHVVKYGVYAVAVFLILTQLGIAKTLVDSTFILIVAAFAVAFAISFGIGGRDFARTTLACLQKKLGWTDESK
jgi:hypothetical protein